MGAQRGAMSLTGKGRLGALVKAPLVVTNPQHKLIARALSGC